MKVADLQQHFGDLARLLDASGAKAVASDLTAIERGLHPFRDLPAKEFADFLVRAEAYSRGEVPLVQPTGKRGSTARPTRAVPSTPNVDALAAEAHDLYEQAASPSVSIEQIDALVAKFGTLSKDGLVIVAERIGLKGMKSKGKGAVQEAIRLRMLSRKGSTQRAGLIDRPATG